MQAGRGQGTTQTDAIKGKGKGKGRARYVNIQLEHALCTIDNSFVLGGR